MIVKTVVDFLNPVTNFINSFELSSRKRRGKEFSSEFLEMSNSWGNNDVVKVIADDGAVNKGELRLVTGVIDVGNAVVEVDIGFGDLWYEVLDYGWKTDCKKDWLG